MNREIIFRGKSLSNNSWETGFYFMSNGHYFIQWAVGNSPETWCEIDRETLGQFTGLLCKNGNRIFEDDILTFSRNHKYQVVFRNGCFVLIHFNGLKEIDGRPLVWGPIFRAAEHGLEIEIIGNIHENPELLEKGVENG